MLCSRRPKKDRGVEASDDGFGDEGAPNREAPSSPLLIRRSQPLSLWSGPQKADGDELLAQQLDANSG
jgi:hypothetical protein